MAVGGMGSGGVGNGGIGSGGAGGVGLGGTGAGPPGWPGVGIVAMMIFSSTSNAVAGPRVPDDASAKSASII
jgi:hypothetical protein